MKKRMICLFLSVLMLFSMFCVSVSAEDEIKVLLDGEPIAFDVPPQIINERTMVPMRAIFEAMGATVFWEESTQTVFAQKDKTSVVMQINNTSIWIDGAEIVFDTAPQLIDGRTLVPARAVAESLKAHVDWEAATRTVIITSSSKKEEEIYAFPNPVIDFTGDDGTMSRLHQKLRMSFEQYLPSYILNDDRADLKTKVVEAPQAFLQVIDDEIWGHCLNSVILSYMMTSQEEYVITKDEDLLKFMEEIANKYSLHAYQNYEVDAIKLDEERYCILLNMANIYDDLKVDEVDKMLMSLFIAIVYDSEKEAFRLYHFEKSLDNTYAICSPQKDGSHVTHSFVKDDKEAVLKKAFVEGVKQIVLEK